jgi:hypothetical protein
LAANRDLGLFFVSSATLGRRPDPTTPGLSIVTSSFTLAGAPEARPARVVEFTESIVTSNITLAGMSSPEMAISPKVLLPVILLFTVLDKLILTIRKSKTNAMHKH